MNWLEAVILGIVQGATEFLPVSSSGHLAIMKYIFGLKDVGLSFDILLHVGTLIAVVAVYYKDIWNLIVNAVQMAASLVRNLILFFRRIGKDEDFKYDYQYEKVITSPYKKFVLLIIISTIPVGLVGVLLQSYIERISAGLLIPGICLLITGVLLLLAEAVPEGGKAIKGTTIPNAIAIGVAQACAVFPGLSRSGATISAGMICGLKKEFAVKYSFILSIPAILGAACKQLIDILQGEGGAGGHAGLYILGMVVAAVVGYAAIRILLIVVKKRKFKYFAIYCFVIGLVAIIGFFVTR